MLILPLLFALQTVPPGEEAVAPYVQADANAGARPARGDGLWRAFHGQAGVDRIVDDLVARNQADPRITDIFKGQDMVRLRRTLKEQFCYLLGGGCSYSGRNMKDAHRNMGVQQADMAALVENLQAAMRKEGVSFPAQNRLLAKLAPMKRDVVER
ncbi:group 1 truncated hemoglobin [uncultured Sphingomonas sp.]|uniref:group I truncated hemoglobin n=1 Tax=uncultured Sphingomonas sp. TaxID=158754 RepID=UPI00262D4B5D|nr:group 1 truncated hemoglobin [uncultured Sphingomonas sp.]